MYLRTLLSVQPHAFAENLDDIARSPRDKVTTKSPTRFVLSIHEASQIIHIQASRSENGHGAKAVLSQICRLMFIVPLI